MVWQPARDPRRASAWTREEWTGFADRLLTGARAYASPGYARLTLPGPAGAYGTAVDGLEGFARTFLLAGFRIAGDPGGARDDLAQRYADGIAAGVDPAAPAHERWVRLTEHPQAKVEAASIALVLDLCRPWVWDRLSERTREQVVEYLSPVVGDTAYPDNNWLWFRVVVQTFLRSVGGPWSPDDVESDLARYESFYRGDGWYSDGPRRAFDHYAGWAMHLYPVLWSRMAGADTLAGGRSATHRDRLDRYLLDAVRLVGGDGGPLVQGRSLVYRFAAAAPFWAGVLAEVPSTTPGVLRQAAGRTVGHFLGHGVPEAGDLLTLGWHRQWRPLAQGYSGPSSPYWAVKGLLGIALPAGHPVWAAHAEPLPVDLSDQAFAVAPAGWAVATTRADGLVRVANHGTDHATPGVPTGDSPLYARLGYSTATSPLLDEDAWVTPVDQAVALVDQQGRTTHRTPMTPRRTVVGDGFAMASSVTDAHWMRDVVTPPIDLGDGRAGTAVPAGRLEVVSVLRGPWELRLVRVASMADGVAAHDLRLHVGGWALPGDTVDDGAPRPVEVRVDAGSAVVTCGALTSAIASVEVGGIGDVVTVADASPLARRSFVPVLERPVTVGSWCGALVTLTGTRPPRRRCRATVTAGAVDVCWPDGVAHRVALPADGAA
ncbi:DUF2264 domain-containing protein [Xylanimonas allomyrinae]|uniref:DUF2264 domain-containing protein n=1 Tax=Xylanimonas allomyrinae TaxID=2509459 RepID=A0A4P6F2L3_9MICO|nr:DUF2264 domain-containing protein [Xylanimonas allomyrinae]QAY64598.1 DUF2264 domain-containing protein [Xylanimonas allomyrinae]